MSWIFLANNRYMFADCLQMWGFATLGINPGDEILNKVAEEFLPQIAGRDFDHNSL